MTSRGQDEYYMKLALRLARRALGKTAPNPMVGAVIVKDGHILGSGWHHQAGQPHAEIEALRDAGKQSHAVRGATLYVTLEPCSTHGRTPPCTEAILAAGIHRVVAGATDPNPKHQGCGFDHLRKAGVRVDAGVCAGEAEELNAAFNHWIVHRTPWVTLKAAMTLDGKIATVAGESKWITSPQSRRHAMRLRAQVGAILAGVGTVAADDPALTVRRGTLISSRRRIILDPTARTPLSAQMLNDAFASQTCIIVGSKAPKKRRAALETRCRVIEIPVAGEELDLRALLRLLGSEGITHLLVEGGGTTVAAFLRQKVAHEAAFYYAPKVFGGHEASRAVNGPGFRSLSEAPRLEHLVWSRLGPDLFLSARLSRTGADHL